MLKTIIDIANNKRIKPLQRQLIIGYCNDAKIKNENELNRRKIHNKQIFNQCVNALNKSNPTSVDEKAYINIVQDVADLQDEHDIYVVSTTFGLKFYNLLTDNIGSPCMKLNRMLVKRCNTLDTCFVHSGTHKNKTYLHFTGMLLEYPAHKYNKTSTYEQITERYAGYKPC